MMVSEIIILKNQLINKRLFQMPFLQILNLNYGIKCTESLGRENIRQVLRKRKFATYLAAKSFVGNAVLAILEIRIPTTKAKRKPSEHMVLSQIEETCFSKKAVHKVKFNVKNVNRAQQKNGGAEKSNVENRMKSLETQISNWIDALGKGIKGLENKIIEAQSRSETLQYELHKINSLLDQPICVDDEFIQNNFTMKIHLLHSADEADKKQVFQEYVDHVVIQPGTDIKRFRAEISYRVLSGGGEGI